MLKYYISGLALALAFCAAACVEPETDPVLDSDTELESIAQDLSARGYFSIEQDFRRCIYPLCGGWWVKNVNRRTTRCADGTRQERCYVGEINWRATGLPDSQVNELLTTPGKLILRGRVTSWVYDDLGEVGRFQALDAWNAATDAETRDRTYLTEDLGFVCVTEPCFNIRATLLNYRWPRTLSGLNLSGVGASDDQLQRAYEALREGRLLTAGTIRYDRPRSIAKIRPQSGRTLNASQFYLPVEPVECTLDSECTLSVYHNPVSGPEDCYCRTCPLPMSGAEAVSNQRGWQRYCGDFEDFNVCPLPPCANPPPVGCVNNVCRYDIEQLEPGQR